MRRLPLFLTTVILGLSTAFAYAETGGAAPAPAAKTFSDAEKAGIEEVIKDYLTKEHPEVLLQAMQELQRRDQTSAQNKSEEAIKTAADKVFSNPATPVGGNLKGEIILVEFFDYNCGYCKMSEPDVQKIMKEDGDIKMIYKDYPILGPVSTEAAKAALASAKQNAYVKFHNALMEKKDHLSEDIIYQTAKDIGLDVEKLKKDANSDEVANLIKDNLDLGRQIGVRGTPMFIIGSQVFPGALQYDQLKVALKNAHEELKKKKN